MYGNVVWYGMYGMVCMVCMVMYGNVVYMVKKLYGPFVHSL